MSVQLVIMMKARKAEYTDKLGRTWKWNGEKYVYQRKTDRKEKAAEKKYNKEEAKLADVVPMKRTETSTKPRTLAEKMRGNVDPFTGSAKIEPTKTTQVASPSEVAQQVKSTPQQWTEADTAKVESRLSQLREKRDSALKASLAKFSEHAKHYSFSSARKARANLADQVNKTYSKQANEILKDYVKSRFQTSRLIKELQGLGLKASTSSSTAIRGYRNYTRGFNVTSNTKDAWSTKYTEPQLTFAHVNSETQASILASLKAKGWVIDSMGYIKDFKASAE